MPEHSEFASTVTQMYVQWADRCGMHLERLDTQDGAHVLAVSGLGCGEILRAESGVHVLEHVDEERDGSPVVDRDQVHVVVVARPSACRVTLRRRRPRGAHGDRGRRGAERHRAPLPTRQSAARTRQRARVSDGPARPRTRWRLRPLLVASSRLGRHPCPCLGRGLCPVCRRPPRLRPRRRERSDSAIGGASRRSRRGGPGSPRNDRATR